MATSRSIEDLLEELIAWTRFANRDALIKTLTATLADAKNYDAYEASDGTKTQEQVAKTAGLTQPTVSKIWSKWRRLGITLDVDGKAGHLASAADLGIPRPA